MGFAVPVLRGKAMNEVTPQRLGVEMQRVQAKPPGMEQFPFFVHARDDAFISRKIRTRGVWEQFESQLLLSLLRPQDQVLDIGANIGWYTVSAARRVGSTGHVFAFEPDPRNYSILAANIAQGDLSWVTAQRCALGRTSGTAAMQGSMDNQGDLRVRNFTAQAGPLMDDEISVVALDDYLAGQEAFRLERLRILKMDVQGFEYEVFSGARRLLQSLPTATVCFIEFDPALLKENGADACEGLLECIESLGRSVFAIRRPVWHLKKMTVDDLRRAIAPDACFDLVIAHDDALADLRGTLPLVPRLLSR